MPYFGEIATTEGQYGQSKGPEANNWAWWEPPDRRNSDLPEDEIQRQRANSLIHTVRNLENVQREVHEQNLWSAQLYSNRELAAFDWGNSALYRASLAPIQRVGENL